MSRATRLSDVCGTIDELKRLLHEEREDVAADPAGAMAPLLADALFMLERMQERMAEYERFRDRVREVLSLMERRLDPVDRQPADQAADCLRACMGSQEAFRRAAVQDMEEAGESIRWVAGRQEDRLRAFMDLALEIGKLYEGIRGNRPWLLREEDSADFAERVAREHQAWLPPEPHRGELLAFLASSRATVLPAAEPGTSPVVQFNDGGAIPMSLVRYDSATRNFHPATFQPGPTGLGYRRNKD